jgi:hypothetical protein
MEAILGHPSTAVFLAAVAIVLFRWAPGGANRGARIVLFTYAAMAAAVAASYPLHLVTPWLTGLAVVLGFVLYMALWFSAVQLSPALPATWRHQRAVES